MTKLSAARVVGECSLCGGTCIGGIYAVKYGKEISSLKSVKSNLETEFANERKSLTDEKDTKSNALFSLRSDVNGKTIQISSYWTQLKDNVVCTEAFASCREYVKGVTDSVNELKQVLNKYPSS